MFKKIVHHCKKKKYSYFRNGTDTLYKVKKVMYTGGSEPTKTYFNVFLDSFCVVLNKKCIIFTSNDQTNHLFVILYPDMFTLTNIVGKI